MCSRYPTWSVRTVVAAIQVAALVLLAVTRTRPSAREPVGQ
jgi:hypothetical protein